MEAAVARVLPVSVMGTNIWARPDARRAWTYRTLAYLAVLGRVPIQAKAPTSFTKSERVSAIKKRVAATLVEQIEEDEMQAEQMGEEETPEAKIKTMEARMDVLKEVWNDWLAEKDYRLLLLYKHGGELGWQSEDLGHQEKRKLRERAKRFVLGHGIGEYQPLFYREEGGSRSHCVKNRDIKRTRATIHNTYGHFSTGITAGRAYG